MATMLRKAALAFFGLALTSTAWAGSTLDQALDSAMWDAPMATAAADGNAVELVNPVQLASACEATCGANDPCCDPCADCGEGICDCGAACDDGPKWYASVGTVILKRDRPSPGTVVAANPAGTPFSSASDFSFDYEVGPSVALARRFSGGTILEGRYFGVDHTDTNFLVTPGNFIGAGFTGPAGTSFTGKYLTMLDSTEINLRRNISDRVSILGGFRWVELKDELFYKLNGNCTAASSASASTPSGPAVAGSAASKARPACTATSSTAASTSFRATTSSAPSSIRARPSRSSANST
jgi:hypothetical protein